MISYKQYSLLNEALLGSGPLGLVQKQSLGFVSNLPGISEVGDGPGGALGGNFGADGPDMSADDNPFNKKKKPFDIKDDDEDDDMDIDDDDMDDEEDGEDEGSLEDRIADLEAEIASLKAKLGHDEEDLGGDEEELGDEELGDEGDEELGDEELGGKGKPPVPMPASPMMGLGMKKGMKKEAHDQCECGMSGPEDGDGELVDKKKGPTFMMKSKLKKGMKAGTCKKCKAKMKRESYYDRPKDYDSSEKAFWKSLGQQLSAQEVNQKFNDGVRNFQKEDILLPPTDNLETPAFRNPQAGEVGYAPQTRIGDSLGTQTESVGILLKKVENLEKQLKSIK
jgi:hypothetical protein